MDPALRHDIIEWDVRNWSHALQLWQPIIDALPKSASILAIGERKGGLSLWLALQGFNVICTDRYDNTTEAKALHDRYHVSDKITYRILDIMQPDLPSASFDLIIMKSVLGGLKSDYNNASTRNEATQQQAIANIHELLKPGGHLLTADNMKGSALLSAFRARSGKVKGWHYFTLPHLRQLFTPFASHTTHTFGIIPGLFAATSLNAIAFFANKYLLPWLPPTSRYIGITIARK